MHDKPTCPLLDATTELIAVPGAKFLYLLHFDEPRFHARHYLGSSENVLARLAAHASGQGSCLTKALHEDGQQWTLAALFLPRDSRDSIRSLERIAKTRHNSKAYCPLCNVNFTSPPATVSYRTLTFSSEAYQQKEPAEWILPTGKTTAACSPTRTRRGRSNSQISWLE